MLVRIYFHMITPIIISDPLHLDALLTCVHPDANNISRAEINRRVREGKLAQLDLPLQKVRSGNDWIWAAGTIDLKDAKPFSGLYKKAKTREATFHLTKNLMTIGGIYKDNIVRISGFTTPCASFLAATNDLPKLVKTLPKITHLGKLRGFGYGQVRSFSIENLSQDWRTILAKDGIAQRNLPASFCKNDVSSSIAALPPYWDLVKREKGAAPGDAAMLKEDIQLC